MSKQVQDAYIVAATRTPIGRSGRGFFRNTRPDDLLVAAIRSAMKQVPSLDPAAIEDAIVGCSFPKASRNEHGADRPRCAVSMVGGVTVNRLRRADRDQMAADQPRRRGRR
jgi:acetyl-CoA acyltransferase